MSTSQAPSYEELKDGDHFWFQVAPFTASMNETIDGSFGDNPISCALHYDANVTAIDSGYTFPSKQIHIRVVEGSENEIRSRAGKYPMGFIRFYNEDWPSITLMSRSDLVSRMVATLGMVKSTEIEFLITLPVLPSNVSGIYPILSYQYRTKSVLGGQTA